MHRRAPTLPSFRTQTAFTFGAIIVALALALSAWLSHLLQEQVQRDRGAALSATARSIASVFAEGLRERSDQVELLAASRELWTQGLGSEQVAQALSRTRSSRPHAAWIGVADLDGVVRGASDGLLVGRNVRERPWFQGALHGRHVGDVHPAKLLAALLPPSSDGEPLRFVDFASPILHDGRVVGVVGLHGDWAWAHSVVQSVVPRDVQAEQVEVFIRARDGQFLYAPHRTASLDAAALRRALAVGGSEVRWDGRGSYLTAAAPVQALAPGLDLGWTVVVRQPTAIAYADAQRSALQALLAGIAGAAGAVLLAWFGSRRLSRPLSRIAQAALDVERDVPGAAIPALRGNRELAALSGALASMTQRLIGGKERLEVQVQERTQALERANAELHLLSAQQQAMLDNEIVAMAKLRGELLVWQNRALDRLSGHAPGELLGRPVRLLHEDDATCLRVTGEAQAAFAAGRPYRAQLRLRRRDGSLLWVDVQGTLLDAASRESLWLMSDITAMKREQEEVRHIAFHDALTGLPNRLLLEDRLAQAVALDDRLNKTLAVCVLDLDGFKAVNDRHGHAAGDVLLCEIARRLKACVRANDTVARLGGDEFVLLLTPLERAQECQIVLQRVVEAVHRPVVLPDGGEVRVSASIGVACFPSDGASPAQLMQQADAAMYAAKRAGKHQVRFHTNLPAAA